MSNVVALQAALAALLCMAAPGSAKVPFSIHRWPSSSIPRSHHESLQRIGKPARSEEVLVLAAETGVGGQIFPKISRTPEPTQELRTPEPVGPEAEPTAAPTSEEDLFKEEEAMQIVYSACGDSVKPEFLVSLKSLYLFAVSSLTRGPAYYHIHVLSDGAVTHADLAFLKPRSNFRASLHSTYPGATTLFKKCSTERIYLHQHQDFQNIDKLIYVDTDTLWLDDPIWWWTHFAHMNTLNAMYGLAEEAPEGMTWYTAVKIPHWGERGLQAGVLMASLNRIRASNFSAERDEIIDFWAPQGQLPLGDQDVLNIYAYYHPEQIYIMPCIFNFRFDARCPEGFPVVFHGIRQSRKQEHTSFNHLHTFFSKIDLELAHT